MTPEIKESKISVRNIWETHGREVGIKIALKSVAREREFSAIKGFLRQLSGISRIEVLGFLSLWDFPLEFYCQGLLSLKLETSTFKPFP